MHHRWPRWGSPLLLITTLLLAIAAAPARADDDDDDDDEESGFLPGEVVVKLLASDQLPAIAGQFRLDPMPVDQFGSRPIYRLRVLDGVTPPDKAEALAADPRVIYAEPVYVGQTPEGSVQFSWASGGDAGDYTDHWAPATLRLAEAHAVTRGAGVRVAVLDTGVDAAHPALAGRLLRG